jgi:hypothetical protein
VLICFFALFGFITPAMCMIVFVVLPPDNLRTPRTSSRFAKEEEGVPEVVKEK